MGSGKSSVGRELPALLASVCGACDFLDLDEYICVSEGMSVQDIFRKYGEGEFRRIETRCLEDIIKRYSRSHLVLALGGGAVMANSELIHENTECFYLNAAVETLEKRLQGDTSRPLLQSGDMKSVIEDLMSRREETYRRTAHHTVQTDGKSIKDIAREILSIYVRILQAQEIKDAVQTYA